jgi:hypothetical protein
MVTTAKGGDMHALATVAKGDIERACNALSKNVPHALLKAWIDPTYGEVGQ